MRITSPLNAQHLSWMFKKHWQIQGKRVPNDSGAVNELNKFGIQVKDVDGVIKHNFEKIEFSIESDLPKVAIEDELHPRWNQRKCYTYGNVNILFEGMRQAQVLTKTIEIKSFPKAILDSITNMSLHSNIDRHVHHLITSSHILDAEQIKLPKLKLLDRPAYNLPREYGVSQLRKNRLLTNRLLSECEKLSGKSVSNRRRLIDDANFKVTVAKFHDLIQFDVSAEKFITSNKPIEQIRATSDEDLPDLHPIKYTISMPKTSIYTKETFFPFRKSADCSHPHTIISYFNNDFIGNIHDLGVSTSQFHSRTLLKAFAAAAARARQIYGETDLGDLPKPIVVQSVQTDGRTFHFGIFQLNTLLLGDSGELKNYWFHEADMDLFEECGYKSGRSYLKGYNKDVFRCLNAFYNNA